MIKHILCGSISHEIIILSSDLLPTIVWFTETYQQVKKEDVAVIICLKRNRNLHREDKVSVVAVNHGEGKKEFFQLIACIVIR